MAIIHRIGTPENDSEARAIKRFGKDLRAARPGVSACLATAAGSGRARGRWRGVCMV